MLCTKDDTKKEDEDRNAKEEVVLPSAQSDRHTYASSHREAPGCTCFDRPLCSLSRALTSPQRGFLRPASGLDKDQERSCVNIALLRLLEMNDESISLYFSVYYFYPLLS